MVGIDFKDKLLILTIIFLITLYSILFFYKIEEFPILILLKDLLPVIFCVLIFFLIRKKTNNYISEEYLFDISITITSGLFISCINYLFILDNHQNKEIVWWFFIISTILMLIVLLYFYLKVNLFDDIFHLISELLMSLSLNGIVIGLFIAASEDLEKFYEIACKVAAVSLILMALAHGIFRFSMAKGN